MQNDPAWYAAPFQIRRTGYGFPFDYLQVRNILEEAIHTGQIPARPGTTKGEPLIDAKLFATFCSKITDFNLHPEFKELIITTREEAEVRVRAQLNLSKTTGTMLQNSTEPGPNTFQDTLETSHNLHPAVASVVEKLKAMRLDQLETVVGLACAGIVIKKAEKPDEFTSNDFVDSKEGKAISTQFDIKKSSMRTYLKIMREDGKPAKRGAKKRN